jgi:hypothetical protein
MTRDEWAAIGIIPFVVLIIISQWREIYLRDKERKKERGE